MRHSGHMVQISCQRINLSDFYVHIRIRQRTSHTQNVSTSPKKSTQYDFITITIIFIINSNNTSTAKRNRGPQLCSICHHLRAGREVVLSNGQKIRRSHEVDCKIYGPCTNINCGHPTGHRDVLMAQKQQIKAAKAATLKRKQDNLAARTGIKPDGGYEFDQVLQQTLQEAGFNR